MTDTEKRLAEIEAQLCPEGRCNCTGDGGGMCEERRFLLATVRGKDEEIARLRGAVEDLVSRTGAPTEGDYPWVKALAAGTSES